MISDNNRQSDELPGIEEYEAQLEFEHCAANVIQLDHQQKEKTNEEIR